MQLNSQNFFVQQKTTTLFPFSRWRMKIEWLSQQFIIFKLKMWINLHFVTALIDIKSTHNIIASWQIHHKQNGKNKMYSRQTCKLFSIKLMLSETITHTQKNHICALQRKYNVVKDFFFCSVLEIFAFLLWTLIRTRTTIGITYIVLQPGNLVLFYVLKKKIKMGYLVVISVTICTVFKFCS
jgi:hypothetical protein